MPIDLHEDYKYIKQEKNVYFTKSGGITGFTCPVGHQFIAYTTTQNES